MVNRNEQHLQEERRLQEAHSRRVLWKKRGPYLSERQWGTVREDYSPHGNAWDYLSYDQALSRAYRWGEGGIAGISDDHQQLCFALALWNGVDPILPVEVNALWYNTLRILAAFLAVRDASAAKEYSDQAYRVRASFLARFQKDGHAALADGVDGPNGDDWTLRPNQIFAISLPFPLLEGADAAVVVDCVGRSLLTSYGLRSLSPDDAAYRGVYEGNQYARDTAYHQGPVWTWLVGAFAEAHYRAYHDPVAALAFLRPFADHLHDAGLGTISEILDGEPPHLPCGCIAQAWSVADEVLRVWRQLEREVQRAMVGPSAAQSAPAVQLASG